MGGVRQTAIFKVMTYETQEPVLIEAFSELSTMAVLGTNPQNTYKIHTSTSCRRKALLKSRRSRIARGLTN